MSLDNDEMIGSEFALTPEEEAALAAEDAEDAGGEESSNDTGHQASNETDTDTQEPNKETPTDEGGDSKDTPDSSNKDSDGANNEGVAKELDTNTVSDDAPNENNSTPQDASNPNTQSSQQHEDFQGRYDTLHEQREETVSKRENILSEIEALGTQLDDGDIGEGVYNSKLKRLEVELSSTNGELEKIDQSIEGVQNRYSKHIQQQQEQSIQAWQQQVAEFIKQNPAYSERGVYAEQFDKILFDLQEKGALDGLTHTQIISTVQHRVEMQLGKPKQQEQPKEKETGKPQQPPKRENVNIPPGLDQMQVLEQNPQSDEFANIDKLTGLEYEAALQNLESKNPEAYKRYMNQ